MSGKAIILSAPSGSGKTTLVRHLLESNNDLAFSISATTRAKRGQEKDGIDYFFLTPSAFREKIQEDAFIEWEEVYEGLFYGTLKSEIDRIWKSGKNVIFDVDVKGGLALKKYFQDKALAIFLRVPSIEILRERLRSRGTDTEDSINKRVEKAQYELSFENKFDAVLVNHQKDVAKDAVQKLYTDFKAKTNL
jgi:guanylate kinase